MTLSWYDPPNDVFVAKCLLHDLDLLLTDPNGQVYYGNTPVSGNRPAMGSKRDELNNNEQVHITAPIPGVWQVAVQAKLLSESPFQNYSLVITTSGSVVSQYRIYCE